MTNQTKLDIEILQPDIILLDYQATLVSNFHERQKWMATHKRGNYTEWIKKEEFREKIIELTKGKYIILITARPSKYKDITMQTILEKTGWKPNECYFNEFGLKPPECKKLILKNRIYPVHGMNRTVYMALESNASTRSMYKKEAINAFRWDDNWTELPKI